MMDGPCTAAGHVTTALELEMTNLGGGPIPAIQKVPRRGWGEHTGQGQHCASGWCERLVPPRYVSRTDPLVTLRSFRRLTRPLLATPSRRAGA